MIKVNLLKNKGVVNSVITPEAISLDSGFKTDTKSSMNAEQFQLVLKMILMFSGAIILFTYQKVYNQRSKLKVQAIEVERDRLQELRVEKEERANTLPALEKKLAFFKERVDEFDDATKYRLAELEALDAIQSSITRQAWVNSVSYTLGKLDIRGGSYTGPGFDEFNQNLERQSVFKSVRYTKVSEASNGGVEGPTFLEFQITAEVDEGYLIGR